MKSTNRATAGRVEIGQRACGPVSHAVIDGRGGHPLYLIHSVFVGFQGGTPADAAHPIRTREQLRDYDPGLFALVNQTMAYENRVDWRYQPYQKCP